MKIYTMQAAPMSDAIPEAIIDYYAWEKNDYRPYAAARVSLWEDALFVRLSCREKDPLVRCHHGPDGTPWLDSCLEFFFMPEGGDRYLNLEMNAGGGYCCSLGPGREGRVYRKPFVPGGEPKPTVGDGFWRVDAVLSVSGLKALFGVERLSALRGNFFKCGEETEFPHYGMWNPVGTPTPDFHRPEFFAPILLPKEV